MSKLSFHLILMILFVNGIASLIVTFTTLLADYRSETLRIGDMIEIIHQNNASSLGMAIWNFDERLIKMQMEGLLHFRYLRYVEVTDAVGAKYEMGDVNLQRFDEHVLHINYKHMGLDRNLGLLKIRFDRDEIFRDLSRKFLVVFLSQMVKALLASLVLFFMFRKFLVRPIQDMQRKVKRFKDDENYSRPVVLKKQRQDELGYLFHTISEFSKDVSLAHMELKHVNKNLESLADARAEVILEQQKVIHEESRLASLGKMAGGIAHEINTPLASALLQIGLLKRKKLGEHTSDVQGLVSKVELILNQISSIIKSMRAIYRDSSLETTDVKEIRPLIDEALLFCQDKLVSNKVEVDFSKVPHGLSAAVKPTQISQIVVNLISNAIDATKECDQKWIRIVAVEDAGAIKMTIADSGKGIPKLLADKIFDPYFTTKEVGQGTGLGLSLSKTMIEGMGGELRLDTDSANTTFCIKLLRSLPPSSVSSQAS